MRSWQRWLEEEPEESTARTLGERLTELEAENGALRKALRSALKDLVTSGALTKEVEPVRVACPRCQSWFPRASLDSGGWCGPCREAVVEVPAPPPRLPPTGVLRVLCKKCQALTVASDLDDGECSACRGVGEGRYR